MTLLLEIDHLTGHAYSARGPESEMPEWPPQPDRIFSALVASWAARGERPEEKDALIWLERQDTPVLLASAAEIRSAATAFVPPNDAKNGESGSLPAFRRRQPRRFPAAVPHDPVVRVLWAAAEPEDGVFAALDALARDTAYVGHSASLTRCRFLRVAPEASPAPAPAARGIYDGRFAELVSAYQRGRRPSPGVPVRSGPTETAEEMPASVFSETWMLLVPADAPAPSGDLFAEPDAPPTSRMPDVRAAALVAKTIRDTILCGYGAARLTIPAVISGHAPDGTPTRDPHLAILTLPFAGFAHADGHVMGFALVPPRGTDLLAVEGFRAAMRAQAPVDPARGQRILSLVSRTGSRREDAFALELAPVQSSPFITLDAALYAGPATTFATVTPIALDRHPKETGAALDAEIGEIIAESCARIGLPRPALVDPEQDCGFSGKYQVVPGKHSALAGAAPARRSGRTPTWTDWRRPASLSGRPLIHAVIRFAEPVRGPVILGAGRFMGLGLCRPLDGAHKP